MSLSDPKTAISHGESRISAISTRIVAPRPTHLGKASQSARFVWRARPTAQAGSPAEAGTARQSRSGKLTIPDLINIGGGFGRRVGLRL